MTAQLHSAIFSFFAVMVSLSHCATLNSVASGMPSIVNLDAKCGRSGMTVHIYFDQPFPGVIYSKGHYSEKNCNYVTEKSSGNTNYTFLIPVDKCGTDGQFDEPTVEKDMFFQNTIIIQMDPLITEVWDEARQLKCIWPHSLLRRVKASPITVQDPQRVTVKMNEQSINTLMEIQDGRGPFVAPALGYVYMGEEESSLVMYIQDPTKTKDANVVNCAITTIDGRTEQLIDDFGCLLRPDLMTYFDKSRTSNGVKADLMLYSYLKGLHVTQDSKFVISCQLEVCDGPCSSPCINGPVYSRRRKRSVSGEVIPSAVEEAVLIVQKEQLDNFGYPECGLSRSVLISGLVLLSIIALLSLLSCYLALRLSRVHCKH